MSSRVICCCALNGFFEKEGSPRQRLGGIPLVVFYDWGTSGLIWLTVCWTVFSMCLCLHVLFSRWRTLGVVECANWILSLLHFYHLLFCMTEPDMLFSPVVLPCRNVKLSSCMSCPPLHVFLFEWSQSCPQNPQCVDLTCFGFHFVSNTVVSFILLPFSKISCAFNLNGFCHLWSAFLLCFSNQ